VALPYSDACIACTDCIAAVARMVDMSPIGLLSEAADGQTVSHYQIVKNRIKSY